MADDTVTLRLEGDVPLASFSEAVRQFSALMDGLTTELGGQAGVTWIIADLQPGSALVAVRGEPRQPTDLDRIERTVGAFGAVAKALERGQQIPYSPRVTRPASNLVNILSRRIPSIHFETPTEDATVTSR